MTSKAFSSLACKLYLLFSFAVIALQLQAQLQANFTVDNASGCSPLSVKFTNSTTGKSPTTAWTWDLGNGNSSALFEPGATYRIEQKYTITLTAKDGANTSVKSMDIIVYKKPTLDFSVSPANGCIPLPVSFVANATPGDGTIAQYLWDYGDGKTEQGVGLKNATHTYTDPQTPPITLTVTNNYGCYSSLTKINLVEASENVKASFTASATTLCNAGEKVTFTNNSTGSGILSYSWDFGDGQTSVDPAPVHSFNSKGNFAVKLTTKSSNGCSITSSPVTINVANFTADFDVPALLCQGDYLTFINKGAKPFDRSEWWVDNNSSGYSSYYGDFSKSFDQLGEHTIKLINYYGNCSATVTKKITINKIPRTPLFIADVQGACGVPVTVNFKDTSSEAAKWEWKLDYSSNNSFATTQNASYNFTIGSASNVYLKITNKEGCSNALGKYIYYGQPNILISVKNTGGGTYNDYNYGKCGDVTVTLQATPDSLVKDVVWDFGDGSPTSTQKNPTHTYSKNGDYTIILNYTTVNGCKGTVRYSTIRVIEMPVFDITVQGGTTICGNTPTTFSISPPASGWYYSWTFGDYNSGYYNYGNSTITQKFDYDTTYTVRVIATNNGCYDTILKKDFIKVLPPFPKIGGVINTCNGKRGDVIFTDETYKAQKWSWNFGDGSTPEEYTIYKDSIRHTYTKTGTYKVVLTTTYGGCTVKDSITAYVLLKQNLVLSSTQTDACGNDVVNVTLSGYDSNPYLYYSYAYVINQLQYGDLTSVNTYSNIYWQNQANIVLNNLAVGKNDLRLIATSNYFGCHDTTNFIPIKTHGPQANFKKDAHSGCFKDPMSFTDLSTFFGNRAIVKWEWSFGDGTTKSLTTNGSTSHLYNKPGNYYVSLKVTDVDGCTNQTDTYSYYISVGGPKADFSVYSSVAYYSYSIPPNTLVNFYNSSSSYDYYSSLKWIFSDGTTSTNSSPSFTFKDEGAYDVKLITYNSQTGCTDTIKKTITVRKVNSVFTYKLSYINNNSCPPVIASFTSLSTNAAKVSWSFGDGGIASNQKNVSHTYTEPGIYRVVHYSFDIYNNVDSTEDFIEVKGPYALLKADKLSACKTLDVRLDADVKYADNYTWDFGDGTLVPTTDVFAIHTYQTPGIYTPALILKDPGGCSATSELADKVVVDSLHIHFTSSPAAICNTALVTFTSQVNSLSKDRLQTILQYRWIIKEDNISDTLYTETASHAFTKLGTHSVTLTVTSPYGCEEEVTKPFTVKPGVKALISGNDKICEGEKAIFTGDATPSTGTLIWKWNFDNGTSSNTQNPPEQVFNTAGQKTIELIVDNGNCPDTARHILNVIAHPSVKIDPANPFVCLNKSIQLTASGGNDYKWTSTGNILNANTSTPTVNPLTDLYYFVVVKNDAGCSTKDSVFVKVVTPIKVLAKTPVFSCEGSPVQLQATGADTYKWLPAADLNNAEIATPILTTKNDATITVIGYDKFNCFTDTVKVDVHISKLPIVNAGADQQTIAGTETTLNATVSSNATTWSWQPPTYLSCTNCLAPVCKPRSSIDYTLTATTADGCKATDEVHIQLICKNGLVYIPSAFTPNQDKLNERFSIHGSGIKTIRHFIIYDRWGKIVFEKSNINMDDNNAGWDGKFKGQEQVSGNYVYSVQIECEAGDIFNYKGSVVLIR